MNLRKLTYHQIYYVVIASVALLAICVFFLSIQKTVDVMSEYYHHTERIENIKDAPQKIDALNRKIKQMEHLLVDANNIDTEQLLLEKTTQFCQNNRLTLIEFPQTYVSEYSDYEILTNKIVLEGSFRDNLLFIYDSEQKNKIGMVASIQFIKKKDMRTKRESLFTHIYFQNIKLKKNKI